MAREPSDFSHIRMPPLASPDFVIRRNLCQAHGDGQAVLCTMPRGHDGPHHFVDCRNSWIEFPTGGVVRFGGFAR